MATSPRGLGKNRRTAAADPRGGTFEPTNETLERDTQGRLRVKALDGIAPLAANASLADVVARVNLLQRQLQQQ